MTEENFVGLPATQYIIPFLPMFTNVWLVNPVSIALYDFVFRLYIPSSCRKLKGKFNQRIKGVLTQIHKVLWSEIMITNLDKNWHSSCCIFCFTCLNINSRDSTNTKLLFYINMKSFTGSQIIFFCEFIKSEDQQYQPLHTLSPPLHFL